MKILPEKKAHSMYALSPKKSIKSIYKKIPRVGELINNFKKCYPFLIKLKASHLSQRSERAEKFI